MDFSGISNVVMAVGRNLPGGVQLLGTAFVLDKSGLLATASHVVGTDDTNLVLALKANQSLHDYQDTTDKNVRLAPLKLFATDPFHDLAVLKVDSPVQANLNVSGVDDVAVGTPVCSFGYPHADSGRFVLTQQNAEVGARILIESGGIKSKHVVFNVQARPGQSGSPIFRADNGRLVAILVGSYAPGGRGGILLGGIDPHTLHQTTHAISAEYLKAMY